MSVCQSGNTNLLPYGYKLHENVFFYLESMVLVNNSKDKLKRVQLRSTMSHFLSFLLYNRYKELISDDEIMAVVWESNELMASSNRLWQVSRDLKYRLMEVGLEMELFSRKQGKGFAVNAEIILPIYIYHESYVI